jgi:hypothetical protein
MKRIFVFFLTISAGVSPVWANLGDSGDLPARKATAWQAK